MTTTSATGMPELPPLPELPEPDEDLQGRELAPGVYEQGYTAAQTREFARNYGELCRRAATNQQPGSADAVTLLRELRDCGAISNWLRVSDDLRKRVDAAIDAAQGAKP